jgi:hypothetical protein
MQFIKETGLGQSLSKVKGVLWKIFSELVLLLTLMESEEK